MKLTGPSKQSTRMLISSLEEKSRKEKSKVWKRIAELLSKPSRKRIQVNVEKLDVLAVKFPEKTFIVAGKVLGSTKPENSIKVAALNYSQGAKKAIIEGKGNAMLLKDIAKEKIEAEKTMIVA